MEIDENFKKIENNFDIDENFQSFVFNKSTKDSNKQNNFEGNFEKENKKSKEIKNEILDILEFILITYKESDTVKIEVSKFVIDLLDIFVAKKECEDVLNKIEKICKIFFI